MQDKESRMNTKAVVDEESSVSLVGFSPGKFLTFHLASEDYGIPIHFVKEIISIQKITPVPHFPEYMKGVINLRGRILVVMDLRLRFSLQLMEYHERTCIIVVSSKDKELGLIVDTVADVSILGEGDLEPPPAVKRATSANYIGGMGKSGEQVIMLLDLEKLLAEEDLRFS
jgi:purine-binding chemotaxis protein CheW